MNSQKKMMTGTSKAAGILNRVARENKMPAHTTLKLRRVGFLSKMVKAKSEKPSMKFSALLMLPSNRGRVVRTAKVMVEIIISKFCFLVKSFLANSQKIIVLINDQMARMALNQKTLPASPAVK